MALRLLEEDHAEESVPLGRFLQVCAERDELQAKLSALALIVQNPALTHGQARTRAATVLALETQRPAEAPQTAFRVNLGELAKRAGLIPPTAEGDKAAGKKAYTSGRKQAGQALKELASVGAFDEYRHELDREDDGTVRDSSVILRTSATHLDLIRIASRLEGTRKLQQPRGPAAKIDPRCPACGSPNTSLDCQDCGISTHTLDIVERLDRERDDAKRKRAASTETPKTTDFQSLETLRTQRTQGEEGTDFQTLETGPPADLQAVPQWVAHDGEKVPIDPKTGGPARPGDLSTCGTYEAALAAVERFGLAGVGYMFNGHETGVDLDGCRHPETGAIDGWALDIVRELDSYSEVSWSGTGLHIIVRGSLPPGGRKRSPIEMYDRGRYFTVSGRRLACAPAAIRDRQQQLEVLHARTFPPAAAATASTAAVPLPDDRELIERACRADHPVPFGPLWRGDFAGFSSGGESGRHLADYWLCRHLAYWTGRDPARMDRLFRQSGLMREKWDRPDGTYGSYGQRTIKAALGGAR